ncbi:MAG TPA: hypothetical protein PLU30_23615 [Verrucomicrobiae bacterium]|nr:hypothetical protein [Verrucomicrobiae bacterium]
MNVAMIIGGPAVLQYRGGSFYSKGDITVTPTIETFNVETSRHGKVDERHSLASVRVAFQPSGEWENLALLYWFRTLALGSLITPESLAVSAINTTSDELTSVGHGLATADAVMLHMATDGVLPSLGTGTLSETTVYYVRKKDADTVTLHPTAADATNNTAKIDFADDGTGTLYLDRDHPLVVHSLAGTKLTLHNAAPVSMPGIRATPSDTILRDVEFEGFVRNGLDRDTANSIYTLESAALSDAEFDPADIPTVRFSSVWGAAAPWSSFDTEAGWTIDFALRLEAVNSDRNGLVSRRFTGLEVSAKATPHGISESALLAKMLLQGSGAARGASLGGGDDLDIVGPSNNPYIRLYGARIKGGPLRYGNGVGRIGECEWIATRTFTGGAPNPLFYVGTAAPA